MFFIGRCLGHCVCSVQVLFWSHVGDVLFEIEGMACWFCNVLLELFRSCSGHIYCNQFALFDYFVALFLRCSGHVPVPFLSCSGHVPVMLFLERLA